MPEGDTIHQLAERLGPELEGATIVAAWSRQQGELAAAAGARIESIGARGKNLLLALSGGWSLRVHLGPGGRCRLVPRRSERRPADGVVVIDFAERRLVCFGTARAELVRSAHLRAAAGMRHLGPDLLEDDCDVAAVLARARASANRRRSIGELLLDQRVAAGIGNVVRCEALFVQRIDPWTATEQLSDEELAAVFGEAREILRRSLRTGSRDTARSVGQRYWVYDRTGQPCLRCRSTIQSRRMGDLARNAYFCPVCQPKRQPTG